MMPVYYIFAKIVYTENIYYYCKNTKTAKHVQHMMAGVPQWRNYF